MPALHYTVGFGMIGWCGFTVNPKLSILLLSQLTGAALLLGSRKPCQSLLEYVCDLRTQAMSDEVDMD